MKFKDKLKIYLNIEKEVNELEDKLNNLNVEYDSKLKSYESLNSSISEKKQELKKLDTELDELRDYINETFKKEFSDYDYTVDITDCYIIELNGKKYITIRKMNREPSGYYTPYFGPYYLEKYTYFDALKLDSKNEKYTYLHTYIRGYFLIDHFDADHLGKPKYQKHILKVYPELANFSNNKVPNTYLKKIYYEINDLGNKKIKQKTKTD